MGEVIVEILARGERVTGRKTVGSDATVSEISSVIIQLELVKQELLDQVKSMGKSMSFKSAKEDNKGDDPNGGT